MSHIIKTGTVQEQIAQGTTLSEAKLDSDGRTFQSTLIIESTRQCGAWTELEVITTHFSDIGYAFRIYRPRVEGISRKYDFPTYGEIHPTIKTPYPAGKTRFNRNFAARLHAELCQEVEANIDVWTTWAAAKFHG